MSHSAASPTQPDQGPTSAAVPPQMTEAIGLIARIGGVELVARITTLFHASAVERLAAMRQAVDAGELTKVKRLAHAMKGSAAQVGAETLRAFAHEVERNAESMSLTAAAEAADTLGVMFDAAFVQLELAGRQETDA